MIYLLLMFFDEWDPITATLMEEVDKFFSLGTRVSSIKNSRKCFNVLCQISGASYILQIQYTHHLKLFVYKYKIVFTYFINNVNSCHEIYMMQYNTKIKIMCCNK